MSLSTLVQTYDNGSAEHTLYSERLATSVKTFTDYATKAVEVLADGWSESTCPSVRSLKCKSWTKDSSDGVEYNKMDCTCRTNRLYLETEKCKFHAQSTECHWSYNCDQGRRQGTCYKNWGKSSCNNWRNDHFIAKGEANDWKDKSRDAIIDWINNERTVIKTSIRNYWQNELLDLLPSWESALGTSSNEATSTITKEDKEKLKNVAVATMQKMKTLAQKLFDENVKKGEVAKKLAMKEDTAEEKEDVKGNDVAAEDEKREDSKQKEKAMEAKVVDDSIAASQIGDGNGNEKKDNKAEDLKDGNVEELVEKQLNEVMKDFMK